jgi:hypothetical protein
MLGQVAVPLGVVSAIMVVSGIVTHNSAVVFGALVMIPSVAVLLAIEQPLEILAGRRVRARRVRSSPAGTLFVDAATLKTLVRSAGDRSDSSPPPRPSLWRANQQQGTLRLGVAGATFTLKRGQTPTETALSWQEIAEVTMTLPYPNHSRGARLPDLRVLTRSGQIIVWGLRDDPAILYDALTELQAQWSKSADG